MNASFSTRRFVAGLQAGMAGALVMLAWLGLAMIWAGHSVWWFPNLMATTFGGDPALRNGFGKYTAPGFALHLLLYSLFGGAFGWLVPSRMGGTRILLLAVIAALGFYFAMYDFVWPRVNPLVPLYSPDRPVIVGHVFFAFFLARVSRYAPGTIR